MIYEIQGRRSASVPHPRDFIHALEVPGLLSISFPAEPDHRVRRVVTRSRARRTYKYPSWKMDRMVECDSANEKTAARLYDLDPTVISFHEQALIIRFVMGGEVHWHIPDFVIRRRETIEIDEIKDETDSDDSEIRERTATLKPYLARLGIQYRVRFVRKSLHEPTIRFGRQLLQFGRFEVNEVDRERVRRYFSAHNEINWRQINDGLLGEHGKYIIARLVLEGSVCQKGAFGPLTGSTKFVQKVGWSSPPDLWAA